MLFSIFRESFKAGLGVDGNDILAHATENWPRYERLSENDRDRLEGICTMWGDWFYACENLN